MANAGSAVTIDSFRGKYEFLSNFYRCTFVYEGETYRSSEAAYAAMKTTDKSERMAIRMATTPTEAKRIGRRVRLCPGWNDMCVAVMTDVLRVKFAAGSELAAQLCATGDAVLIEGNTWADTFWGVCNGTGTNWLGRVLMRIRNELTNPLRFHARLRHIQFFTEGHRYYVDGRRMIDGVKLMSTTAMVDMVKVYVTSEDCLAKLKGGQAWKNKASEWYGMSDEEILAAWAAKSEASRADGSLAHAYLEDLFVSKMDFTDRPPLPDPRIVLPEHMARLESDLAYLQPLATELLLFDEEHALTGQADIVCRRWDAPPGEVELGDWKRVEQIEVENKYERGLPGTPVAGFEMCNNLEYHLQINIYQWLLERHMGVRVAKRWLYCVHPKYHLWMEVVDMQPLVREVLAFRKRIVEAMRREYHRRRLEEWWDGEDWDAYAP
jgi:ribA/ribD-fused uncharacterized protein